MLKDGGDDRAALVFIDQNADFSKYSKVILEPVTVWHSSEMKLAEEDTAEIKALSDYLFAAVQRELSKNYEMVSAAGPDVMRVRIALTEAIGANVAMNTASTIVPIGLIASSGKKLATGSHAFVGKAAVELEILDSSTNERIAAAVDERAGSKNPIGGKWADSEAAFDYWAERLDQRLQQLARGNRMEESFRNLY